MGDRANIVVLHAGPNKTVDQIWLYGHWIGDGIGPALQTALQNGKGRWDDPQYLTRIIFESMVPKESHGDETGFGITVRMLDNEHRVLVCDIPKQRVYVVDAPGLEDWEKHKGQIDPAKEPRKAWSFAEWANLAKFPKI